MKETLRKAVQPFSFIWRAIALTLVICATTCAWAANAPTPDVVWDGDFLTREKTVDGVTYSINNIRDDQDNSSGNICANDGSYLQVVNNDTKVAVTVTAKGGDSPFGSDEGTTIIIKTLGMPVTADANRALILLSDGSKWSGVCKTGKQGKGGSNLVTGSGTAYGDSSSDRSYCVDRTFTAKEQVVAFTHKASSGSSVYVNGSMISQATSTTLSNAALTTPTTIVLGGVDDTSWTGTYYSQKQMKILSIAVFKKALSAEEVAQFRFNSSSGKWGYASEEVVWLSTGAETVNCTTANAKYRICDKTSDTYALSTVDTTEYTGASTAYQGKGLSTEGNNNAFWRHFAWSHLFAYPTIAPGFALRFIPDPEGTTYAKTVSGDFGPLLLGGLIVDPGASGYKLQHTDGTRTTIFGDPTGCNETWFEFNEDFTVNRNGFLYLNGIINIDIAGSGDGSTIKKLDLNNNRTDQSHFPKLYKSTSRSDYSPSEGGTLKMHGYGQIEAKKLTASGATLDYSDLSSSYVAEYPFINTELVVSDSTKYVFPALGGAATYRLAKTLSEDATRTSTFTIGDNTYTAPLTFSASSGTVSFPAVATLSAGSLEVGDAVIWPGNGYMPENMAWDAKPGTISSTTPVVINVSDDTLLAPMAPISVKSLTFNISEGKTLALYPSFPITTTDGIIVNGGGTLRICEEVTINGDLAFTDNSTITFDSSKSIAVNGSLTISEGKTLTVKPTGLSASATTLVTASSINGSVALGSGLDNAYNYTLDTSSGTSIVLYRVKKPTKTYTAAIGNWTSDGWGSFGNTSVEKTRVGPNATWSTVMEISSGFNPYSGTQASSDAGWTFAIYADVSKMSDSTSSRPVIAAFGNYSSAVDSLILYREGSSVKLRRQKNNNPVADWAASVPVLAGFHLYTFTCDPTTGRVALYVDAGGDGKVSSNADDSSLLLGEVSLTAGFQVGSVYGANPSGFVRGDGMALAAFNYYDTEMDATAVALLAGQYPATDGTKIYGQVDNRGTWNSKTSENACFGSAMTVYSGAYQDDATLGINVYLGMSQGTLTIPEGEVVSVPFFKVVNCDSSSRAVTVNLAGRLNVTTSTDSHDIYSNRSQGKGILFGHYHGTGEYNITGSLIARDSYMQTVFTAESQTINVNGGTMAVKGYWSNKASVTTVNLTNNGIIEVKDILTAGQDPQQNFGYGTFKLADATDGDREVYFPITFSGTAAEPTKFDPNGHTLTLGADKMKGSGYVTVNAPNGGTVVFSDSEDFSGTIILTDANASSVDIDGYTGKVLCTGIAATTLAKLEGFEGAVEYAFEIPEGQTLTLTDATGITASGAGTLEIPKGGVVTITSSTALDGLAILSGEGELRVGANIPSSGLQSLLKQVNANDSSTHYWKGTLVFDGLDSTATQNWIMGNYGNSDSKIQFENSKIQWPCANNNDAFDGKLVLVGESALKFDVDNGYSNNRNMLGELTGSGTLTIGNHNNTQLYMFKSSPEFNGSIATAGRRIMFANAISDGTANYAGDAGDWAKTIRIAPNACASIGADANWVAYNGIVVSGTLIVKGDNSYLECNNSATKGLIFNNGSTIRYDAMSTLKLGSTSLRTPNVASDAIVKIAFGEGVLPVNGTKLLSWGGSPAGNFEFDDASTYALYELKKESDGLYLMKKPGTIFSVY